MQKSAAPVYSPQDPLESAIQSAFHKFNEGWLPAYPCQLFAKSIIMLKSINEDWLDSPQLLEHRISYFFAPHMTSKCDDLVFVTSALFLRDILENERINCYLHSPVVFMTRPLAHYLFREYPVHVFVDGHKLLEANKMVQVGGLFMSEDHDVDVSESLVSALSEGQESMNKAAATERAKGVFHLDEHEPFLAPGADVWDKSDRRQATVQKVEPGPTGLVELLYSDSSVVAIPKQEFDSRFVNI